MVHLREINKINLVLKEAKSVQEIQTLNIEESSKISLENKSSNEIININIKENLEVEITQIIEEKNSIKKLNITLEKNSKLILKQLIKSTRYHNTITTIKEGAEFEQRLVYLIDNEESFITSKAILDEENSKANMIIKGAAQNGSRVICDGTIYIDKKASKSQGAQEIRGLLLDSISNIQNEPILEIHNNDVICSHSASIAQIKDEIKFFMQSRGLDDAQIKQIVLEGLIGEVIGEDIEE